MLGLKFGFTRDISQAAKGRAGWKRSAQQSVLATSVATAMVLSSVALGGCESEGPDVGQAAAPSKAKNMRRVMGSDVSNLELSKRVALLEDLLDGKESANTINARFEKDLKGLQGEERDARLKALQAAFNALPEQVKNGKGMPAGPERDMIMARLYYTERRFIEAAKLLSTILDQRPDFPEARNLLARSFFFLGNHDRTIQELEYRLQELEKLKGKRPLTETERIEEVDAHFLIGAAVLESPGTSRKNLEKGKVAWETYLRLAPRSPSIDRVREGLEEIRAGLRGEGRLARGEVVRAASAMGGGQNVMGGQQSFGGGGGPGGPAPKEPRYEKALPKDATPFQVAEAKALDALLMRNPVAAEKYLRDAEQLKPGQPSIQVGMARVLVLTGQIPEALKMYGEIIKRTPNYMPAWHYNGMAHLMSNDPKQAAESWMYILKNDPEYAKANALDRRIQVAQRMAAGQ